MAMIYGHGGGVSAEFDLKNPEERKNGMAIARWIFIPIIIIFTLGLYCFFTGRIFLAIIVIFICVFAALLGATNEALKQSVSNVENSYVTYHIDTTTNDFEVKDSFGRDVTEDYRWTVSYLSGRFYTAPHGNRWYYLQKLCMDLVNYEFGLRSNHYSTCAFCF